MAMHGQADTGLSCSKCDKSYATKQTLKAHEKDCVGELRCAKMVLDAVGRKVVCGVKLKTIQGFRKHVDAHERKEARLQPGYVPPAPKEKKYRCDFAGCGQRYISANGLRDHQKGCESNPAWEGPWHCPHPECKYAERNGYVGWKKRKQLNAHLSATHGEGKNLD